MQEPTEPARTADLRHACTLCGACCQGAVVHLIDDQEIARTREQAAEMGMADPVQEGAGFARLRQVGGRCIMLDDDNLCRLHAQYGADDKPMICRQFPYVRIRTEQGSREGIDPAAGGLISEEAMPLHTPPASALVRPVIWEPGRVAGETQLLHLLDKPGLSTREMLCMLCGRPELGDALPPGFAARWVQTLKHSRITALIAQPEVGPVHRAAVQPILGALTSWSSSGPPSDTYWSPRRDALALRSIRGMLFLRLAPRIPSTAAVAMLVAGGALAASWACEEDEAYGAALANWCRLLRAPPFWGTLMPSGEHMAWLATGRGTPPTR